MNHSRSLIQGATVGIFRSTADGRFVEANPALAAILGYASVEELLAIDCARSLYRQPETRQRLREDIHKTGRLVGAEVEWLRKDRTPVLIRLSGRGVPSGVPGRDDFEAIVEDVGERRRMDEHMSQLRKLATVGQLAGGVAHNFNNLLTSILGFTEWLLGESFATDAHQPALKEIERAGRQAASLTRQLLAFSSSRAPSPDSSNLNTAIRPVCQLMADLARSGVRINFVESAASALVKVELNQIEQAVVHLILNAHDALPRGGLVQIAVGAVEQLPPNAIPPPVASTGPWVSLRVQNDGEGLSVGVKGHAVEPSLTTRRPDRVGLGLSVVHGIVQQNDGSIVIETLAGGGSAVTLFFPGLTRSPRALRETADGSRLSARPTVLVVDEHAAIRSLVRRVLSPRGIHVIEAETGEDAVAFSEHETIDVLLIDGHLDRKDGSQVAQCLASRMPNLAVVYMSGGFVAEGSVAGISRASAISKPFDAETLAVAVQQALTAQPVRS